MKKVNRTKEQLMQEVAELRQQIAELETLATEHRQIQQALQESEERYRSLFDNSPISIWEEDHSAIKTYIDGLRDSGVKDFKAYFANHPEVG